uniref:Uncharacterized protein n=1 Tax=Arundo donax TaxID=35708 RepID=A0A0A9C868_ARUDO
MAVEFPYHGGDGDQCRVGADAVRQQAQCAPRRQRVVQVGRARPAPPLPVLREGASLHRPSPSSAGSPNPSSSSAAAAAASVPPALAAKKTTSEEVLLSKKRRIDDLDLSRLEVIGASACCVSPSNGSRGGR